MRNHILVPTLILSLPIAVASPLELTLTVASQEQLFLEYNEFSVTLTNNGHDTIQLAKALASVRAHLFANGKWHICKSAEARTSGGTKLGWHELSPGSSIDLPWPGGTCLCDSSLVGECPHWNEREGTHRFKIVWTHQPPASRPRPTGTFDGTVESNSVQIRVRRPVGIDAEAYEAKIEGATSSDLLKRFPFSRYTAHLIAREGGFGFSGGDAARVLDMIDKGVYVSKRPLPTIDSGTPGGGRTHDPEEVLSWRAKWFNVVLDNHPDVWYADDLRLRLAIDKLAAGDRDGASEDLQALVKKGSGIALRKASEYLSLMVERGMIRRDALEVELGADSPPGPAEK